MKEFNCDCQEIQLAISLKLQQLKRDELPSLQTEHIMDCLYKLKWKRVKPSSLYEAVNDIMNLTANDIVIALSAVAITDSKNKKISDFNDLIGG